jgi:hypothetical protein
MDELKPSAVRLLASHYVNTSQVRTGLFEYLDVNRNLTQK